MILLVSKFLPSLGVFEILSQETSPCKWALPSPFLERGVICPQKMGSYALRSQRSQPQFPRLQSWYSGTQSLPQTTLAPLSPSPLAHMAEAEVIVGSLCLST